MQWKSWTIFQILFFLTFLISGLLINVCQGIGYLLLPRRVFRRLNYYLQWSMYGQFIFLFDWWSGSEVRLYGPSSDEDAHFGSEHALILCNHHYETDWLFGWIIAERFRAILKYVPILGWGWALSDIIYVKRDWSEDQKMLPQALKTLHDYPHPWWLLIYAEGTRFTDAKHKACEEFRLKSQDPDLPHLRHHLIPRLKGFYHTLMNLDPRKVPAIYDVTIVAKKADSTISRIIGGLRLEADVYVRRIPIKDIEKNEASIKKFLMKTYAEKDALIDTFIQSGTFGKDSKALHFPERRLHSLINVILLNFAVLVPCSLALISVLMKGSSWHVGLLLSLCTLLYFGMKKMIGITKVKESSDYGSKKSK
ncbi:1-acyl-sn-glycerol-3-phosphate acyltransferase gamma [Caligus rogercresseyi]|uniref:1-acyl-sn-glycerol-3-phosphate acyltransferase gamma n=1 Tax=Caligus rogercresseyi TaxID=217165 RepID=A0A7T8H1E7_CALRO|nr:1-acyl-sn-glycerol-3-phosphate acyltransferase gamma [Caligus rogercresseyi]